AFYDCRSLTSIIIPDSVTTIGTRAFQVCTLLETVTFLGNVPALGNSAFTDISASATAYYLTNTDNVTLATYFSKIFQYSVDESNATITSFLPPTYAGALVIPDTIGGYTVTAIGSDAFVNRSSLTSIEIPISVTSIGANAFNGCAGLTSIAIPASVTSIGANALSNCTSLTSITVTPNNAEFVSADGVLYNKPETTLIQYPIGKSGTSVAILNTVQTIAGYALWNCINIESISVPASVQTISEYAFQGCINLSNVSFTSDSQLETIDANAFEDCAGLKSIEIPVSVTTIDNTAFIGSGLIRMYVYKNNQLAPSISPPQSVTYFGKTYKIEFVPSEVTTAIKANADFTNLVTDLFPSITPSTDVITTTETVVNDRYVISSSIITIPDVSLSDLHPDQRRQLVETITNIYAGELNVSPDRLIVKLKSGSVIVTVEVLDDTVTASMVPICFPAGTKVTTDQGNIAIEKLNPSVHTIRGKKIVAITKSIPLQKHIVSIEKDALVKNVPSVTTHISKEHQIFYKGEMVRAIDLVGVCQGVTTIPYNGEILYNVLLKKHGKMMVNNLICETLHPENIVARIHSKNFTPSQIDQLCVKLNRIIRTGNAQAYEKLHVALK
ncbi:MAG: leucine-rich repeat protein, partial [Candidatus Marinimicrobia bacterium]|nr:leucine-rich repeat protein [Candidatus Neomarinimicrobiota bacterium]